MATAIPTNPRRPSESETFRALKTRVAARKRSNTIRSSETRSSNASRRSLFGNHAHDVASDMVSVRSASTYAAPLDDMNALPPPPKTPDDSPIQNFHKTPVAAATCRHGHIQVAAPRKSKASGLTCDICSLYIGHQTGHCRECNLNYCSNCSFIRKLSLKALLAHEDVLKKHGHKPMIADQLVAYGAEISQPDTDGELPLHVAIKCEAPSRAIETIICIYPDAISLKDPYGYLPLHLALMFACAVEVIEMLLDNCPAALLTTDLDGLLPVHLAIKYHAPVEVLSRLIAMCPGSIKPYGKGASGFVRSGTRAHRYIPCSITSVDFVTKRFLVAMDSGRKVLVREPNVRFESTILHFAVQNRVDRAELDALLEECPMLAYCRDINGELAFHAAVRNKLDSIVVLTLLRANPSSGSTVDNSGQLPVQIYMKRFAELEIDTLTAKDKAQPWQDFLETANNPTESAQSALYVFRATLKSVRNLKLPKHSVNLLQFREELEGSSRKSRTFPNFSNTSLVT